MQVQSYQVDEMRVNAVFLSSGSDGFASIRVFQAVQSARGSLKLTPHSEGLGARRKNDELLPPPPSYLENTVQSMQAAFDLGASAVELDIHPTKDEKFAVFHDWTLDCRANGKGPIGKKTLQELQRLHIGYGYTFDRGQTFFPFRGKNAAQCPRSPRCLSAFPIPPSCSISKETPSMRDSRSQQFPKASLMLARNNSWCTAVKHQCERSRIGFPKSKRSGQSGSSIAWANPSPWGVQGASRRSAENQCTLSPSTSHLVYGAGPIASSNACRSKAPKSLWPGSWSGQSHSSPHNNTDEQRRRTALMNSPDEQPRRTTRATK